MIKPLVIVITGLVAISAGAGSGVPKPLTGIPLRGATHLRLLVASNPPYVLDVDSGHRTRIAGLTLTRNSSVAVSAVGHDAVIDVDQYRPGRLRGAAVYVLRHGETKAARLATAWEVASADDGAAVWLKSYVDKTRCTLREVWLDGSPRTSPRSISCSAHLVDSGSGALLVDGTAVVGPATGERILDVGYFWAVAGGIGITMQSYHPGPITLTDLRTGESQQLRYPSIIAGQGGADEAAADQRRRLVALSFSDPAYLGSGTQVTDVWLLNLTTRQWQELPDMPAAVSLKFTSMHWAGDGRLIMLAETHEKNVVAVWCPRRARIRVRPVRITKRNSGSDSFVVWSPTP